MRVVIICPRKVNQIQTRSKKTTVEDKKKKKERKKKKLSVISPSQLKKIQSNRTASCARVR